MRRRAVRAATVVQLLAFVAVIAAIGAVVRVVRVTAPEVTLPPITAAAPDPDDPGVVTCERTLPDAPQNREELARVDPVGRITSTEVIECPDAFDGQPVIYVGEVVGDVLERDGGAWVLVNDDAYALEVGPLQGHSNFAGSNTGLSVWLPAPVPDLVPGRSDRRGTIIEVRGQVLRADPADGGGLTLRAFSADSTRIIAESVAVPQPLNRGQAVAAVVFVLVAAAMVLAERRTAARR